ncbi:MAG: transcriptional regulator [Rhodovulum sulfidophilum]|uniref:Transcriptional regulator n=1 Tax=Rhodovulum sulfidophilum TaxID=35806 RepID=A0A2W5MYW0_RHOSU|nr:MAG: transcriptional regulator [Rhodovulum sulfidophilum]
MLDGVTVARSHAEIVQMIYEGVTGEDAFSEPLSWIRDHFGADGAQLDIEARDPRDTAPRVLRSLGALPPRGESFRLEVDCLRGNDPRRYRLTLARIGAPFADADRERAEDLLRHLQRAEALTAKFDLRATESEVYAAVLDRLAVGAIFLDARGQILRRTGLAEEILEDRDGLRDFRGAVAATAGTDDRKLQAAIRAALEPGEADDAAPQTVVVTRPNGGQSLGLVIQPLSGRGDAGGRSAAVIFIRDPERGGEPEKTMLRRLFDLTPAEAELARNLTAGFSLDEAAAVLAISRNTARAHLRAIFSKSGITRQTELMRLMLNSAAMLGGTPLRANT